MDEFHNYDDDGDPIYYDGQLSIKNFIELSVKERLELTLDEIEKLVNISFAFFVAIPLMGVSDISSLERCDLPNRK